MLTIDKVLGYDSCIWFTAINSIDFGEYLDEYKNKPAQKQAEEAFDNIINKTWNLSSFFLCLVAFACNNGVEMDLCNRQ